MVLWLLKLFFCDQDANKKYGDSIEVAVLEEKAARELLKSKRQEIDSLQVMINKVKNAISIEDIDGRVCTFFFLSLSACFHSLVLLLAVSVCFVKSECIVTDG